MQGNIIKSGACKKQAEIDWQRQIGTASWNHQISTEDG